MKCSTENTCRKDKICHANMHLHDNHTNMSQKVKKSRKINGKIKKHKHKKQQTPTQNTHYPSPHLKPELSSM